MGEVSFIHPDHFYLMIPSKYKKLSHPWCFALLAIVLLAPGFRAAAEGLTRNSVRASDFPRTAARTEFFEERINAPDWRIRYRTLTEVGYFYSSPDEEYVSFLKRMANDPSPEVCGAAIKKLYDMWVPLKSEDLPRKFSGYHQRQLIDKADPGLLHQLQQASKSPGASAGYAAYVMGLLKNRNAIPHLRQLTDHANVFVRYAAARALVECGDRETALATFDHMSQLENGDPRRSEGTASGPKDELRRAGNLVQHPSYVADACNALVRVGPGSRRRGLDRLVELYRVLEMSSGANDRSNLPHVQAILARACGKYFLTAAEAKQWMAASADQPEQEPDGKNTNAPLETEFNRTYIDDISKKVLLSRRVAAPPILNGVLDDPCWKTAVPTQSAFIQWQTKTPTPKQTVMYACYDLNNLYMAVVCEELKPKLVRMLSRHPGGRKRWSTAANGDAMEVFLEVGGVAGKGTVFQFIFNIYPEVRYDGIYPPYAPYIGTGYTLGGDLTKDRWTCELAFPFKGFNTERTDKLDFRYVGPPRRGEIWGLRSIRSGSKEKDKKRMRSIWTHNAYNSWHIPWPAGLLVLGDRNALVNGKFNEVKAGAPAGWEIDEPSKDVDFKFKRASTDNYADLTVEAPKDTGGIRLTQSFGVLPGNDYRLTARVRKNTHSGKFLMRIHAPEHVEAKQVGEWEDLSMRFRAAATQRSATVTISILGKDTAMTISEIRVDQLVVPPK
ncbi:MAG: hypothetical protein QF473_01635 [Planctomycetota bacterium]|nr:hypothetical protein [Planctomycetota bacterium]